MNKPKLTSKEIIAKLKEETGITFNNISESDAEVFLTTKNNYYRLASYRKNYDKKLNGENIGKYIGLDFSYLVDLSQIDMRIRFMVMKMCLDIEHDLKVMLLNDISQDKNEDGYSIVTDFLEKNVFLYSDIYNKRFSTYVGDLINKFFTFDTHKSASGNIVFDNIDVRCPIWAFVEIISFGAFIKLYDFYYGGSSPINVSLINPIKNLRNACAHNNCIINNLRSGNTKVGHVISDFVSQIDGISRDSRKKHLSVRPIFEFIDLIMVYDKFVSAEVKNHRYTELKDLVNVRITKHSDYYKDQQLLSSCYKFIKQVVDFIA